MTLRETFERKMTESTVTNKEILDFVDSLQTLIVKLKNDAECKYEANNLWKLSRPFVRQLHTMVK